MPKIFDMFSENIGECVVKSLEVIGPPPPFLFFRRGGGQFFKFLFLPDSVVNKVFF